MNKNGIIAIVKKDGKVYSRTFNSLLAVNLLDMLREKYTDEMSVLFKLFNAEGLLCFGTLHYHGAIRDYNDKILDYRAAAVFLDLFLRAKSLPLYVFDNDNWECYNG